MAGSGGFDLQLLASSDRMLSMAWSAATAAMAALLMQRLHQRKQRQLSEPNLPPGPQGWPVLGNLLALDPTRAHETVAELCKKYGPIMSLKLGSQLFIVINDYKLAKEMLDDPNFAGRPQSPAFQRQTGGCGILFTEGAAWKQHRRLALMTLRGFSAARSIEIVNQQLDTILTIATEASESGRQLNVQDAFMEATNAVIATLTLGRQFNNGDPELEFVRATTRRLFASRPMATLPILFPWTDYFVRLFPASDEINQVNEHMLSFIQNQVAEREKLMRVGEPDGTEPECLCDAYILRRRQAEAAGDFETFKDMQITRVVLELFFAGTDTTARTLEWLLLYMAFEPDWQTRLQAEMDAVVGSDSRRPTMQDRSEMHLTCAVIEEVYRLVSLIPFTLFHRAMKDAIFHGFVIPSSALILPFIYGMSRDPGVWSRPNEFYPEHFLSPDGIFSGPGKNIPFSMGRRVCVGESLARMEVFLIFSAVLQRFRVRIAEGYESKRAEILRGTLGIIRLPGDYRLVFEAR